MLQSLYFTSNCLYNADKVEPITLREGKYFKPKGGLWVSPKNDDLTIWEHFCSSENFNTHKLSIRNKILISNEAKVCTMNTLEDFHRLHKEYPAFQGSQPAIDWIAMSKNFDVFHLTEQGQAETRMPTIMYGWDIETIFIFNPSIIIGSEIELQPIEFINEFSKQISY